MLATLTPALSMTGSITFEPLKIGGAGRSIMCKKNNFFLKPVSNHCSVFVKALDIKLKVYPSITPLLFGFKIHCDGVKRQIYKNCHCCTLPHYTIGQQVLQLKYHNGCLFLPSEMSHVSMWERFHFR